MAEAIVLVPKGISAFKAYASIIAGVSLLITSAIIYYCIYLGLVHSDVFPGLIAFLILGSIFFYIGYRELRSRSIDNIIGSLLKEVHVDDNKLKLPSDSSVKLVDVVVAKFLSSRGEVKFSLNYKVINDLGNDPIDLGMGRKKPQFFAVTVTVAKGRKIVFNPDNASEIGVGLGVKDKFVYMGLAFHFTYMGHEFLAIPLYPSLPYLKKRVLRLVYDRDYAEAWIRVKNEELHVSMNYMRNRSRSARLELSPLIDIELGFSFYNIELVKMDKTGSISRSFKLPVLEKTYVLIIPVNGAYISSRMFPIHQVRFKNREEYRTLITGYNGAMLRLILDLPMRKDVIDHIELSTKYIT